MVYDEAGLVSSSTDLGGTINFTYYSSGKVHTSNYNGLVTTYVYDGAGNLTSVVEPNSGSKSYTYDDFGRLLTSTDNGKTITMTYDGFGRLQTKTIDSDEFVYNYNATTELLENITRNGTICNTYTYEPNLLLLTQEEKVIEGQSFFTKYRYNALSQLDTITYPGGYSVNYSYDNNGNVNQVKNGSTVLWTLNGIHNNGMITNYTYGNGLQNEIGFDAQLRVASIKVANQTGIFDYGYSMNANDGNLDSWTDSTSQQTESFTYDDLNRLTYSSSGWVDYFNNGNMDFKDDVGVYNYDNAVRQNALTSIENPQSTSLEVPQSIGFNAFNKPTWIGVNGSQARWNFIYGADQMRSQMKTYENSSLSETKYYVGNYEKIEKADGSSKEYTYISAPTGLAAVNIKESNGSENLYYIHTDYLGSIMALSNENGNLAEKYSYDAWGNRRDPNNWLQADSRTDLILDRGYTGHDHLDGARIINMNGRMYDPLVGRMLSPDPVLQDPYNTQNYNRYSYVMNNPLKYTDPTGYRTRYISSHEDFNYYESFERTVHPGVGISGDFGSPNRSSFWWQGWNAGTQGYFYSDYYGGYVDNATGDVVDFETALNNVLGNFDGELAIGFNSISDATYYAKTGKIPSIEVGPILPSNFYEINASSGGDDGGILELGSVEQGLMLTGIGLLAEKSEGPMQIIQMSDAEIKAAALRNGMNTERIDQILARDARIMKGAKIVGTSVVVVSTLISGVQGVIAFNNGDMAGATRAGIDIGVGLGTAAIGGVPGVALYLFYISVMDTGPGVNYSHPYINLQDKTRYVSPIYPGN